MNITVDNQEFEKTPDIRPGDGVWYNGSWYKPVSKFKEGDWVTFYSETYGKRITDKLKEWTSHTWCKLEEGLQPFKHLIRLANSHEIETKLKEVATQKGFIKGAKVYKDWDGGSFVTIVQEDSNYYPETDEFAKSGIILYRKGKWVEKVEPLFKTEDEVDVFLHQHTYGVLIPLMTLCGSYVWDKQEYFKDFSLSKDVKYFSTQEKAQEYIDKHKPKTFTFGGYECSFKVEHKIPTLGSGFGKIVKITCKGETGTHWQIEEILKNYFRPCKFGNVEVQSFTWSNIFRNNKIEVIRLENDLYAIDKIKIGCLTGTYKELNDIYNHCLNLLK